MKPGQAGGGAPSECNCSLLLGHSDRLLKTHRCLRGVDAFRLEENLCVQPQIFRQQGPCTGLFGMSNGFSEQFAGPTKVSCSDVCRCAHTEKRSQPAGASKLALGGET